MNETDLTADLRSALERLRGRAQRSGAQRSGARKLTFDVSGAATADVVELVAALVHAAGLTPEERVEVLASAFAAEAVRPYWGDRDAERAHERLRLDDEALADALESLAPWLIERMQNREAGEAAVDAVEELLRRTSEAD